MPDASATADELVSESVLTGLARGRFGRIAPERIAKYVARGFGDADAQVKRAAFDALVRRYAFAQRDGLRVAERPDGMLGAYRTVSTASGKGNGRPRPYTTALYAIEPLRMSCACADFVRSSLGLCKHCLIVLDTLEQRGQLSAAAESVELPSLGWAHEHPLRGSPDRLLRLRWRGPASAAPSGMRGGSPSAKALADPRARLQLIQQLEAAIAGDSISAEPAVPALLAEERVRASQRLAVAQLSAAARKSLGKLSRKLYPFQLQGVERFFEIGRLLLADDMGLGKTTQAIAICHALLASGQIKRALLIVPSPLKAQWLREWQAITSQPLTLVEGSPKERKRAYERTKSGALAIGYEQLLRDLAQVQSFGAELVVLDEAQRIKNWATKSAAYVKSLAPAYRLVLTGTPMENRFDELASIMDFVDDIALEPKWRLLPFHTLRADGDKSITGARNLDVLRQRLSGAMLRRVRGDVLAQLPARTDTRVPVEMTEVQRTRHDELRQPIAELAGKASRRGLAQAEFLQLMQLLTMQRMICNGMAQVQFESDWPRCKNAAPAPALLESLFAPKLSVLRGLIEQLVLEQRRKVVVFSQWRKFLCLAEWAVRDLLQSAGMHALFFTGAESPAQRERAIATFHEDANATVMFLSDAGGVGLNLQRAASSCINLELPWNPAVLEQRIGRVYRLGQTLPIDVYNLVTEDGIEGRIAQLLEKKRALFSTLFDGTSDEVTWDGGSSFVDSVQQLVEPLPLAESAALEGAPDEVVAPEPSPQPQPTAAAEPELPQGLSVTRLPDGGLRIEASAALAEPLSELLASLAKAVRAGN
jgi:superfamily II DNA or RNA helicase